MSDFKNWFENKLVVSRYPTPKEVEDSDFNCFINVSDEYIQGCYDAAINSGKRYFWFPMNECTSDMGVNSIYAALQILFENEKNNNKVYLHCHAGVNRSPTVKECYYFMRTGNFLDTERPRLIENIEAGCLPSINKMKRFINEAQKTFKEDEAYRGGGLDNSKLKSSIQ